MKKQEYLFKRRGLSIDNGVDNSVLILFDNQRVENKNEFIEICLFNKENKLYSSEISSIKYWLKGQKTSELRNKAVEFRRNVKAQIEKEFYNHNLTIKQTSDFSLSKHENEIKEKCLNVFPKLSGIDFDIFCRDYFKFSVAKYSKIYKNLKKQYNVNDKKLEARQDIDLLKRYLDSLIAKFNFSIDDLSGGNQLEHYFYTIIYDNYLKGKELKGSHEYYVLMYLQSIFKRYSTKIDHKYLHRLRELNRTKNKNQEDKDEIKRINDKCRILVTPKEIKNYVLHHIYNYQSLQIIKSQRDIGITNVQSKLDLTYLENFISSLQLYISFAGMTLGQFYKDKDRDDLTKDVLMNYDKHNKMEVRNDKVEKFRFIFGLDLNDDYNTAIHDITHNVAKVRHNVVHYIINNQNRALDDILKIDDIKTNELRLMYENDYAYYHKQLIARLNSNQIYKIECEDKQLTKESLLKLVHNSLMPILNDNYTAPKFKFIIQQLLKDKSKFKELLENNELDQNPFEYLLRLHYLNFIKKNEFKESIQKSFLTYMESYKHFIKAEELPILFNILDDKNISFIDAKKEIQAEISRLNNENNIVTKESAKKLESQLHSYEVFVVTKEFINYLNTEYDKNQHFNINEGAKEYSYDVSFDIQLDDLLDYNNLEKINIFVPLYSLGKVLDTRYISLMINDIYRYMIKTKSEDTISSSLKHVLSSLRMLASIKDHSYLYEIKKHNKEELKKLKDSSLDIAKKYFEDDVINGYLTHDNNEYEPLVLNRVQRIYHYGLLVDNIPKIENKISYNDLKKKRNQLQPSYEMIKKYYEERDFNKRKKMHKEFKMNKELIHKYEQEKFYQYGGALDKSYKLLNEIQSRLFRTIFLIERDIKYMFMKFLNELNASGELNNDIIDFNNNNPDKKITLDDLFNNISSMLILETMQNKRIKKNKYGIFLKLHIEVKLNKLEIL